MKKRISILTWMSLFVSETLMAQEKKDLKTNIIVIITDQQFADAMSCRMGHDWINTPAMDKLAKNGVVFMNAYSANPICVPSRNSIITGRLPHQLGILSNANTKLLDKNKFHSVGTYFKEAGYKTAYYGKWHINIDERDTAARGFDDFKFASSNGKDSALPEIANKFLTDNAKNSFLLFLSFLNPHNICEMARGDKLPDGPIAGLPSLIELPPLKNNIQPTKNESDGITLMRESYHRAAMFPVGRYKDADWRRLEWGYYRLIEKVDTLIGKVLESVHRNGLENNTLIVFTSDHGECLGAHQFNQKTVFYEESSRVPFMLSYNHLKRSINNSLVSTGIDLLPTLLDFAHIKIPDELPGKSMWSYASKNKEFSDRKYIVSENKMVQGEAIDGKKPVMNGRMVRSKRYKYCLYDLGIHREELFDLKKDPGETVNIASDKSSKSILAKHQEYLKTFAIENQDNFAIYMLNSIGYR